MRTSAEITAIIEQSAALFASAFDGVSPRLLSDTGALAVLGALEQHGRVVGAWRTRSTTDVANRARPGLGHDSLAWKRGCRDGADLITTITGISRHEVRRRTRLGELVTDRDSLTATLPPLYPAVLAGLTAGDIGIDTAEAIAHTLNKSASRCAPDDLHTAERNLVTAATGAITEDNIGLPGTGFAFPADLIREQAMVWMARLDPDGIAPNEQTDAAHSEFSFGALRDGYYPVRAKVTPELLGVMNTVFDSHLSARTPAFPTTEEQERMNAGEVIPGANENLDTRTAAQKRADILMGMFAGAARSPETPRMGGASPTVLVHVNATDLADKTGVGWLDGVDAPLPLHTVEQLICAGGLQKIVIRPDGEVLHLGAKERFFSPAQRRAMAASDGGCIIPGCTIPAHWCEAHHITPCSRAAKLNRPGFCAVFFL